jgi:type I site-specific restriction endonuclease
MELTESQTRSLLINPQLLAAGWKLAPTASSAPRATSSA